MSEYQNYLALDVGSKRIGLARADAVAKLSQPLGAWPNDDQFESKLNQLIEKEKIAILVVGLPRGMEGQNTNQTSFVLHFTKDLKIPKNIKIVLQDEAVTSVIAEAKLRQQKTEYSKEDIDAEAACLILEDYLNAN